MLSFASEHPTKFKIEMAHFVLVSIGIFATLITLHCVYKTVLAHWFAFH